MDKVTFMQRAKSRNPRMTDQGAEFLTEAYEALEGTDWDKNWALFEKNQAVIDAEFN